MLCMKCQECKTPDLPKIITMYDFTSTSVMIGNSGVYIEAHYARRILINGIYIEIHDGFA